MENQEEIEMSFEKWHKRVKDEGRVTKKEFKGLG